MDDNNQHHIRRNGEVSAPGLLRSTGIFAIMAGLLYIVIQLIHPPDQLSAVPSTAWIVVACLSMVMSLFFLIGLLGMYLKQVKEVGWLGLIGFILFSLFWLLSMAFGFMEAFVLPLITDNAPKVVEGITSIFGGGVREVELGFLPVLAPIAGILYLLGGLVFGFATYRARVLPRQAAALLAFGAVVTLAAAVIPHPVDRILAVPTGLAFIWSGYRLWSEHESKAEARDLQSTQINA